MARWVDAKSLNLRVDLWRNATRMRLEKDDIACNSVLGSLKMSNKTLDYGYQLGLMIAMNIVTENIGQVRWPSDWWQAFKERWFGRIFLKKFPVNYKKVDVRAIYPKCSLNDPILKANDPYNTF